MCLQSLQALSNENLALNAISKAFSALYLYDYLLTIGDEVQFAWKGRKTWLFSIYVLNRYATMGLILLYWIRPRDSLGTQASCSRTVIVDQVFLVCITLFSQLFMALKVYAVTSKNKPLTGALVSLMVSQLAFGIFSTGRSILDPPMEAIKLPDCEGVYRSCALGGKFQMAYTALSLAFGTRSRFSTARAALSRTHEGGKHLDVLAFMAIICFSHPWKDRGLITTLQRTICQDSTGYFLSVLSIQIFVTVAVSSGAPYPRALFPVITNVLIPLMVSRIVLSLRKAASPVVSYGDWTVKNLTTVETGDSALMFNHEMQFRRRTAFSSREEE
ncbi:hypothetical protein BJ322DRAFT_1212530 [Thelephora terrestris]|uniref:DUF6533 domain-containing protein n=1 Tax=Thelephora terrestris TaxID=56493 RepID=A0A9P6HAQ3_9AGAM|nr:hypothetical protein BJ322DRAFT_1212530 [Thelephora terrestris]